MKVLDLTNILIKYKLSNPIRFMFQVVDSTETDSSCPEPRTNFQFAQPKPIRSTETDSLDRNRFDRDYELHRTEILAEIARPNVRIQMSESESENHTKTF